MRWLVTRHPGAVEWAAAEGIAWDRRVSHLCVDEVAAGDEVYGTLPAHRAAQVIARGAVYHHLLVDVPEGKRGRELTAADLKALGARFVRLHVETRNG